MGGTVHVYSERARDRALDLCACDGQMWGNLPVSIRRRYFDEACAELAAEDRLDARERLAAID